MKEKLIKKLALIIAVCAAAGTVTAAIAAGAGASAQQPSETATPRPTLTPTITPRPTPTPEPLDHSIWGDGVVNILLIGTDEQYSENDKGRGDVTLLCSLNRDSGSVKLVSFERSIGMPWPEHGDVMLTNTYAYGGAELMCQDISRAFRVDIDGYVQLDFEGFCSIIDSLGGVDILLGAEEAKAMTEDTYNEIWYSEGLNHLDGESALRYCRLRRIDDNWHRVERQRYLVSSIISQAKNLRLGQIKELAHAAMEHVNTSLTKPQLAALLVKAPRFIRAELQQMTIPNRNNVWTYNSGEETVTGCDFGAESRRLNEFIYGSQEQTQPVMSN
ncbi:MAG: LCP family protein [Oscillospiraceae bacterium]|nr:LCP family protein [Oscillospiraceae bacterium]